MTPATTPGNETQLFLAGVLFTPPELASMALDGVLRRVYGDAYVRPGTVLTPALRAAALAAEVPAALASKAAVGRQAAAWVYGCAPAPQMVDLLIRRRERGSALPLFSGCRLHEVALGPFDAPLLGTIRVTTALRTAVDVALCLDPRESRPILEAITTTAVLNCPLGLVRSAVDAAAGARGRRPALALLAAIAASRRPRR
ncbi:hypothetical protein [Arthrobacter sp. 35W]|uniref:hypothetical protein n=1 Tax=Arthrobacter sp. 35W TaxID=1132441 RepID=UPI0004283B8A|nr:hypothetical protein [Arthrobacter sp. 35W]